MGKSGALQYTAHLPIALQFYINSGRKVLLVFSRNEEKKNSNYSQIIMLMKPFFVLRTQDLNSA